MRALLIAVIVIGAAAFVAVIITVTLPYTRQPAPNPLCTSAAASQLAAYWNAQISQASYTDLQNVEAEAIVATAHRLDYCKGHGA
jgi:hypothetical protein